MRFPSFTERDERRGILIGEGLRRVLGEEGGVEKGVNSPGKIVWEDVANEPGDSFWALHLVSNG